MTPERWRQLTEIFSGAVAIGDTVAREAYLVAACGSDASLRAQLDSLIIAYGQAGSLISDQIFQDAVVRTRLDIGTMLGPYQVEGLLGAGGMGEVYRARDTRLDRTVALKVLPPHLRANPKLLSRFKHEARAIGHLNHPLICTLHDVGRHDNIDYLVMELVEGETLSERLRRGRLPIDEAISVTSQVAEALAAAHAKGVIHRDIKPSNIVLTTDGRVKVVDFGLARESPLPSSTVTPRAEDMDHGLRMGTLHYMSAEQALGLVLDARTDVFSLGVVLFECLTGQLPFEGVTRPAYLLDLVQGTPKSVSSVRPEVPHALQTILGRCLERDRSKRLDSAALLAEELKKLVRPGQFTAWTLAVAVLAGVLAVVLLVQWSATPEDSPPRTLRRFTTNPGEEIGSRLSPDGSWMSFMRTERGEAQLVVQRTDPGAAEPTHVMLPPGELRSHLWSPDETGHAALVRNGKTWTVHIASGVFGDEAPVRSIPLPGIPEIPGGARLIRWIGHGIFVYVEEPKRSISLRRLDVGSSRFEVVSGPWTTMKVSSIDVRPDGAQVAWIAPASGSERDDIWTASIKESAPQRVTPEDDTSRKRDVIWSALGTTLIYQSNRGGQPDLWELDVKTRSMTRLTTDPGQERPESSSADGSISYQLSTQRTALYQWREGKGPGTQLSNSGLSDFAPSASSGNPLRLAYQRSQAAPTEGFLQMDTEIHVSDVLEPEMTLGKSTPIATGIAPKISPDGRYVAYLRHRAKTDAELIVSGVETTEKWEVSPALLVPTNNNFPIWWEQTVAWLSARELCFVERTGSSGTSRLMRYRLGEKATLVTETKPTTRITGIYPSSTGTQIAYLTRTNRPDTPTRWDYAVHVADLTTGIDRVVKHLGTSTTIRLRGWLANDAGVLLARPRLSENPPRTYDLWTISPTGVANLVGNLDNASNIFSLVPNRSELYFTSLTADIGNLFAYSLIGREKRPLTDSPVVDLTYGAAVPLGPDYVVGIRHELVKDIHLLDARSRTARSADSR